MFVISSNSAAFAENSDAAQIKALQAQIELLSSKVKQLATAQARTAADAKSAQKQASRAEDAQARMIQNPTQTAGRGSVDQYGHTYLQHKDGTALTFFTPGGEITGYGNIDVSFDDTAKNIKNFTIADLGGNTPPVGNFSWMPAFSTNNSYLGARGFQRLGDLPFNFLYQAEVGFEVTALPGTRQTNSNLSNSVNGALFNRNTFIGLGSSEWGAIKVGKTDAPYKNSTGEFNPFAGQIGDYAVVMGNTGGDNRVEFGTRINHAIWYESPKIGGFNFNVLFAPGQNRATDASNLSSGESDCAGGNDPSSGANPLNSCSDGAYTNVVSTNLSYSNGGLLVTGAYERHMKVNRQSDLAGAYGLAPVLGTQNCSNLPTPTAVALCLQDVADEDAAKIGVLYKFATKTTVGGIFESMHRYVPSTLAFQNERTRNGTWLFASQELSDTDSVHFGWAHAFKTPGDPGQHNTSTLVTADGATFGPNNNQADMVTASYKKKFSPNLLWYTSVAATFNGPSAHYDLGAGGRGVTTDCHDANATPGGLTGNPRCFAGTTLMGASTGLKWMF